MKKITTLSLLTSSILLAGGYKIPEQSLNSMALSAAYLAHTKGADTAYYNPANMAFMEDRQFAEAGVTLAHLPRIEFEGDVAGTSGQSEIENILIPNLHYVGNAMGDVRWGASLTAPAGLTKRWNTPLQKLYAEEFTLKVIEFNPVASYRVSDNFAVGGGLRFIYSEGVVNSDGGAIKPIKREMVGDTIEFGYNLALTYKPTPDMNMAVAYRSNIDLKEEGTANLYLFDVGNQYQANVTVPLPAVLNVGVSQSWEDTYTLELVYERSFWSSYKTLDFNYDREIQSALVGAYADPKIRNWKDTDTFRLGATAKVTDSVTLMAGIAQDKTPVPSDYVGYELPDSDAMLYSLGVRMKATENLSYGVAYLHDEKDNRTIAQGASESLINGTFSQGGADLLTVAMAYTF
ncbi:MAG: long-chain fatty acid transporter [Sulfurovum sp. FS06-10]|jgi:long-chain fatty acid transport protein|nr:MAG: long-chain fatty acid transporter [Sulfurovum sp. FS06-10]